MGKVKRQAQRHSNHHDNPRKGNKSISRRQHSQKQPPAVKKAAATQSAPHGNPQARLKVSFTKFDNVLLVGEGDFSFSLSLKQHHKVNQITATCYDSRETLETKYPNVTQTLSRLGGVGHETPATKTPEDEPTSFDDGNISGEEAEWIGFSPPPTPDTAASTDGGTGQQTSKVPNVNVLYGVDATKLFSAHKKALRAYGPFTKIVFNFPHVGGLSTDVNRQVRYNQELLVGFFKGAKELLSTPTRPAKVIKSDTYDDDDDEDEYDDVPENESRRDPGAVSGQILVTLFEGEPYTLWNIRDLARHSGLKVVESFKFPWSAYPGYQHARTIGEITTGKDRSEQGKRKGAWRGEERDARCYVLEDKDAEVSGGRTSTKRKKRAHDSDGDDGD
ncbi:hypothetical protein LTS17_011563 [Exophiala oligosperma]